MTWQITVEANGLELSTSLDPAVTAIVFTADSGLGLGAAVLAGGELWGFWGLV